MHELMAQTAGVVKMLEQVGLDVIAIRANPNGAQVQINAPLPETLQDYVTDESSAGQNLFGIWVMCAEGRDEPCETN